jgi:hypothetical protein
VAETFLGPALQLFQHDDRDRREVELGRLFDLDPDELDKLLVGADEAGSSRAIASRSMAKKRVSKRFGRRGGVMARPMNWTALRSGRMPCSKNGAHDPAFGPAGMGVAARPIISPVSS